MRSFTKKILIFFSFIFVILLPFYFFNHFNAFADTQYALLKDSNGINWQYGYNPSTQILEVSIFDSDNAFSEITIPNKSFFTSRDSSISTISSYVFTSYINRGLGTPRSFSTAISKIDLSSADVVNGIYPLSNSNTNPFQVVFNSSSFKVGNDAFRNKKINPTNLNKVTEIGAGAFYNVTFTNTEIQLPSLTSIGDGAFEGSNILTLSINSPIIGVSAFKNCTNLTQVTLLDNVNELKDSAFEGDSSLSSFNFNNLKIVGNRAFRFCTSWNINIGNTRINSLGSEAFSGTTNYTSTKIPSGVTQLKYQAFYNSGMTTIDINNVIEINVQVFENCNLSTIDFKNVQKIDWRAFANNHLASLDLPKSISVLKDAAIFVNNPIKKIKISYDTLSDQMSDLWVVLSGYMWGYDPSYTANGVEEVELVAPYTANQTAQINSNFNVSRVYKTNSGDQYGYSHTRKNTHQSDSENIYEDSEFGNVNNYKNVLQTLYLYNLYNLKKVIVGEGYEFLGSNSFAQYRFSYIYYTGSLHVYNYENDYPPDTTLFSYQDISLPSTLKGVGINAFNGVLNNDNLSINLPKSLEYIGRGAFRSDYYFEKEVDLPNLKYIGNYAFEGSGITKIAFRDKLQRIGTCAANFTPKLKDIIIDCDYFALTGYSDEYYPNVYHDSSFNTFNNSFYFTTTYGDNSVHREDDYYIFNSIKFTSKVVTKPKNFSTYDCYSSTYTNGHYVYTESTCTNYNNSLFWLLKAKTLDLEDVPWTVMNSNDFQETYIETLKLPKKLTKINDEMFFKARIKNPIKLPDTITEIGNNAFLGSDIVSSNNLPSRLRKIGTAAFMQSNISDDIIIPSTVISIGHYAFGDLSNCGSCYLGSYINWHKTSGEIHRNSITFLNSLNPTVTNNDTISMLIYGTSVDEIIFGENVTELPTNTIHSDQPLDLATSEFINIDVKKVVFKNLRALPRKAFIINSSIEEVDFSEDSNLESIGSLAFFDTPNLSIIKLYSGLNNLTIAEQAFYGSGLSNLNDSEGIDLKNDTITLSGNCIFQGMENVKQLEISSKLNNGIIPEGTFSDETQLEKVIIYDGVTKIKLGAFANDSSLNTFVMFGNTEIENEDGSMTVSLTNVDGINFYILLNDYFNDSFSISVNNSTTITNGNFTSNSNRYQYRYAVTGDVTLRTSSNIVLIRDLSNQVRIVKRNDYNTTIPSTANLFCYLNNNHCSTWNTTYRTYKENQNSDLYYLDEVLYLDSKERVVKLNESGTDLDKDNLTIYALRRDGVILVSDTWGEKTGAEKYVDSGITIRDYHSDTSDPELMVFNTNVDFDDLDLDTNSNFEHLDYTIGSADPTTNRAPVYFRYYNKIVDHEINTTLKTKGNYVDVVYSDGCGGESFSNVIYEDVLKGQSTPIFTGTPTREGYRFLGWDKEIDPTATDDIIYVAKWEKIEEIIPDINNNGDLTNPVTFNNYIVILFIGLLSIFGFITLRKKYNFS